MCFYSIQNVFQKFWFNFNLVSHGKKINKIKMALGDGFSWQGTSGHASPEAEPVYHCERGIGGRENRVDKIHSQIPHRVVGHTRGANRTEDHRMWVNSSMALCVAPTISQDPIYVFSYVLVKAKLAYAFKMQLIFFLFLQFFNFDKHLCVLCIYDHLL